ncbi:RsmB/NOP family class I SAM-dependent RNA methyltransferase [Kiritimatiellaeota bacterium B1221]|nr:RsmB/NOP family class I SAM-dependent RNA methyltransferase [Kiritimatiellaeota bacterium B1221]
MNSEPHLSQSPERDQAIRLLKDWILKGSLPTDSGDWQNCSSLTREIVWTCMRHRGSLDAWINHLSHKRPSQIMIPSLWVGLCQILLLDGVPEHAAVHETLEAAKRSGVPPARIGFANALFRRTLREKNELLSWLENQSPEIRYSHPKMLVDRWTASYGEEKTEEILYWNQQRSFTYARITDIGRRLRSDLALPEGSVPHAFGGSEPDFYQLPRSFSPQELPDFYEGAWYIQDPSTSMAPRLLNVQPGERVLDACAAPGGKTTLLAEALGDQSHLLLACDPNPKRCRRLQENLDRMQFPDVKVNSTEITGISVPNDELFDAILLDVPCSNTGVYQRRPDAKWNFRRKLLTGLIQLQYQILQDALLLLKPGGRLVYSTCSIEEEETTRQMENWLGQHPECSLESQRVLLPGEENCDGAFAALIRKNS